MNDEKHQSIDETNQFHAGWAKTEDLVAVPKTGKKKTNPPNNGGGR